jgi:hypothetical protein
MTTKLDKNKLNKNLLWLMPKLRKNDDKAIAWWLFNEDKTELVFPREKDGSDEHWIALVPFVSGYRVFRAYENYMKNYEARYGYSHRAFSSTTPTYEYLMEQYKCNGKSSSQTTVLNTSRPAQTPKGAKSQ